MMDLHIQMGLKDPGSLGEPLHEIMGGPDLDRMRKAIVEGQRDSNLIRRCLIVADMQGMSGEDRYVYLAYQALITVERQWQEINRLFALLPNPAPIRADQPSDGR
jgi:hypothetical protein